jgi:hypothetical protein
LGVTEITPESFKQALAERLAPLVPYLGRKERYPHLVSMIKGFLSALERKSVGTHRPLAFAGKAELRNMTNFMTRALFEGDGMLLECQKMLAREPPPPWRHD